MHSNGRAKQTLRGAQHTPLLLKPLGTLLFRVSCLDALACELGERVHLCLVPGSAFSLLLQLRLRLPPCPFLRLVSPHSVSHVAPSR